MSNVEIFLLGHLAFGLGWIGCYLRANGLTCTDKVDDTDPVCGPSATGVQQSADAVRRSSAEHGDHAHAH